MLSPKNWKINKKNVTKNPGRNAARMEWVKGGEENLQMKVHTQLNDQSSTSLCKQKLLPGDNNLG